MNKFLKILFALEFLLILALVALAFIDNDKKIPTGYAVKENINAKNISFKVMTKAVCEEKSERVFCRDELFVSCNGKEYIVFENKSNEFIECDNLKIKLSDIANDSAKLKKW